MLWHSSFFITQVRFYDDQLYKTQNLGVHIMEVDQWHVSGKHWVHKSSSLLFCLVFLNQIVFIFLVTLCLRLQEFSLCENKENRWNTFVASATCFYFNMIHPSINYTWEKGEGING